VDDEVAAEKVYVSLRHAGLGWLLRAIGRRRTVFGLRRMASRSSTTSMMLGTR
jgi:hypothetical protein